MHIPRHPAPWRFQYHVKEFQTQLYWLYVVVPMTAILLLVLFLVAEALDIQDRLLFMLISVIGLLVLINGYVFLRARYFR